MPDLIFDIGLHLGQDTQYYLAKGFRVVGVDANPEMIELAERNFEPFIREGRFTPVCCAVSDTAGTAVFNISQESTWSSLDLNVANRNGKLKKAISVPCSTLPDLIGTFGLPHYCKIDIEGQDLQALISLRAGHKRPRFISVETECIGNGRQLAEAEALATLVQLKQLGYNQFKLVDQATLSPLAPGKPFYRNGLLHKAGRKIKSALKMRYRDQLQQQWGHPFPPECTGPFGEDIAGDWFDFNTARDMLLYHRSQYFSHGAGLHYGFWCDWHAKVANVN